MLRRREFLAFTSAGLAAGAALGRAARHASPAAPSGSSGEAAAFHAARRFVAVPQGEIACVERGAGEAALFLHGFPLNGYQWRGALERLAPLRRCLAPDFLGLGYTRVAPGQSVAPEAQLAMLLALLDTLRIERVDVVANDSGGAIAQLLAVRHPHRVRSLLLTNCDVEPDSPPPAVLPVIELARQGRFAEAWLAPWLRDKALARSAQGLGGMCFTRPAELSDATLETYLAPLLANAERKALTNAYAIGLAPNPLAGITPALQRCQVPTRVVWGTGDTLFSAASPDYLARNLGHSRGVRRVEGAKLFFPEEFPDLLAEEAQQLWRST